MNDVMIRCEDVSMRFDLGIEKGFSLKQGFVDLFRAGKRRRKSDFWALSGVDFSVGRGEVVGLIGANGAGKSTLLKLVAGVMKPTSGRVLAYGKICPMIELGAGFDAELTARENIFLNGAVMGYSRDFIKSRFDEIVAFSQLESFLEVPLRSFSSGMAARLAFSVATVVEPEILIVDEILSVGDLAFQSRSEEKMLSMIRGGTTVLYVSHDIASIKKLCGRAIWLDHGRLAADGGAETICKQYEASATEADGRSQPYEESEHLHPYL